MPRAVPLCNGDVLFGTPGLDEQPSHTLTVAISSCEI